MFKQLEIWVSKWWMLSRLFPDWTFAERQEYFEARVL